MHSRQTDEARFKASCESASEFPKNLVYHDTYDHVLQSYTERLAIQESRLFFDESRSNLLFRDYEDGADAFINTDVCSIDKLREFLMGSKSHVKCRYLFIYAPHSRERLKTTRQMLMFVFTYYQIMPDFLDFIFPFGKQLYAQDFHFSGFRHEERLSEDDRGLNLSHLGRSGRDVRMCYSLKSVEPSKGQTNWPWSIRHTAIYHSFDVGTGRSFWTFIKGDLLIKKRIEEASTSTRSTSTASFDTLSSALSSSLATHLIIFEWCREHWRWYINFLEHALEEKSRETLLVSFDKPRLQVVNETPEEGIQRITSADICPSPASTFRTSTFGKRSLFSFRTSRSTSTFRSNKRLIEDTAVNSPRLQLGSRESKSSRKPTVELEDEDDDDLSFTDLQRIQFLEEKANETLLVLDANIIVLCDVKSTYKDLLAREEWPESLNGNCERSITKFETITASVIRDLRMQHARTQTILRILVDRKSLLYGILDIRNRDANKILSEKAQSSTERMEKMTEDMHDLTQKMHELAEKTKQETVSMRIITLVTLFFLPGTFISTIMSTDILQFQTTDSGSAQEIFQLDAFTRYMEITIPLMLITFAAWYAVYWWVDRTEAKKASAQKVKLEVPV